MIREEARKKYAAGGSHPDEDYESELLDDPDFTRSSTYVPDEAKDSIKKWARDMGLWSKSKK